MEEDVKRLMMALVGTVLAFAGMQVSAQASTIDLGAVQDATVGQLIGLPIPPAHVNDAFTDTVKFTLNTESVVTVTLVNQVFGAFNIGSFLASSGSFTLTQGPAGTFTYSGLLAAADYLISVSGNVLGSDGGLYKITVAAATTPIPGALLLFGTALGGMGFVGFRRRRSSEA